MEQHVAALVKKRRKGPFLLVLREQHADSYGHPKRQVLIRNARQHVNQGCLREWRAEGLAEDAR